MSRSGAFYLSAIVLFLGDLERLFLFLTGADGCYKQVTNNKKTDILMDGDGFATIDDIIAKVEEMFEAKGIIVQKIIIEDATFGILIAITKLSPEQITFNLRALLELFLQFIRLKVIEKWSIEREIAAYRNVTYEKSLLLSEHLKFQERWTENAAELINQISEIHESEDEELKKAQASELLKELKADVEPLQELNRSTRNVVRCFGFYETWEPLFLKTKLKSLFRGVVCCFAPGTVNQAFMENEVYVDPEQINEGLMLVVNILNSLTRIFKQKK